MFDLSKVKNLVKGYVSSITESIADGANELFSNPRKRPRPATPTHSNPSPSQPRTNSPSLFPASPYRRQSHQQQQHEQEREDQQQPRSKKRRVSFPPEPPPTILPPAPQNNNMTPQPQQNYHPFAPIRRESSGIGDALDAPTPEAFPFTSNRSRGVSHSPFHTQISRPTYTPRYSSGAHPSRFNVKPPSSRTSSSVVYQQQHKNNRYHINLNQNGQLPFAARKSLIRQPAVKGYFAPFVTKPLHVPVPTSKRYDNNQRMFAPGATSASKPIVKVFHRRKAEKPRIPRQVANLPIPSSHQQQQTAGKAASFKELAARSIQVRAVASRQHETACDAVLNVANRRQIEDEEERNETEARKAIDEKHAQRVSRSKLKVNELNMQLFVRQQQLLQDQKRRELAQRVLHADPDAWRKDLGLDDDEKDLDKVEKPPENADHWEENYWNDVYGDARNWNELHDEEAIREKKKQITVEVDDDDSDEEGEGEGGMAPAYAPLTDVALRRLRHYMMDNSNIRQELANVNGCVISGEDLRMLKPQCWLNDEVVNAYTTLLSIRNESAWKQQDEQNSEMIGNGNGNGNGNGINGHHHDHHHDHSKKTSKKRGRVGNSTDVPKIKMMNSFFYAKLVELDRSQRKAVYNYQRVRRWTRRFDVFSYDKMIIPINQQNLHWTLGVIDFKNRTVMHLDSMGTGGSPKVREHLLAWVRDEAKERGKLEFVEQGDEWKGVECTVPIQENTDDCGVFLCKFADFISRGWSEFTFTQKHMTYFRCRIAHELLMGKAA